MTDPEVLIPARQGRAVRVARGAAIDVVNTHGTQVVDFWALCSPTRPSTCPWNTRASPSAAMPRVGDTLVSNARRPMLTVVADTSPGVHDTLMASCDAERYRQLGFEGRMTAAAITSRPRSATSASRRRRCRLRSTCS